MVPVILWLLHTTLVYFFFSAPYDASKSHHISSADKDAQNDL